MGHLTMLSQGPPVQKGVPDAQKEGPLLDREGPIFTEKELVQDWTRWYTYFHVTDVHHDHGFLQMFLFLPSTESAMILMLTATYDILSFLQKLGLPQQYSLLQEYGNEYWVHQTCTSALTCFIPCVSSYYYKFIQKLNSSFFGKKLHIILQLYWWHCFYYYFVM